MEDKWILIAQQCQWKIILDEEEIESANIQDGDLF